MGKVVFNMTVSLDGFVAGPNDGPGNGLGDGGDALLNWYFSGDTEISIDGRGGDWNSFVFFSDPDGNGWTVQERPANA